ncbi:NADH dehydrogenase [Balamuthia mandrillaris]
MSFACVDCGTTIPGADCAYTLAQAEGWKKKAGCYAHCRCGYPVRAKELRPHVFRGLKDNDRKATANAYIYCETDHGQGHVYYGTFESCVRGNRLAAAEMTSCKLFERYESAA